MCLILFALGMSSSHRLILAANRDEFYDRPTAPMHFWEDVPHIVAGKDLALGGTWLGMTTSGRFAAVTNYRDPAQPKGTRSRGHLVSDFLRGDEDAESFLKTIESQAVDYTGFNLLIGDFSAGKNEILYFSNRGSDVQKLTPGVYGLSNHLLDTPWPKVRLGKKLFSETIKSNEFLPVDLFSIMQSREQANDLELPDTGIGYEREKAISPMFIETEIYGTRCTSVLTIDENGNVFMGEQNRDQDIGDFFTAEFQI